ncbi:DUF4083 family protein [Metabacillus halosaccharovorans]|uniref:DUF4083 family protein n=1 Tax=Metabacillus halosaccharovorans TaxID=930124 RepID=UPI003735268E
MYSNAIFQLIMILFLVGTLFVIFFVVHSLLIKQQQPNKFNSIEQKLDKIIELLEKDKKD